MRTDEIKDLLSEAEKCFVQEPNLIKIASGRAIFVGDTHGDLEATTQVIEKYLNSQNKVVFLGDYVDRGPESSENINTLLSLKLEHSENLFLLMGNHEGYSAIEFHPADFWHGLDLEMRQRYAAVLSNLPLALSTPNGIIASHGALPDVKTLGDIDEIEFGSEQWHQITWGDWQENDREFHEADMFTGRPQFGRDWFEEIMRRLKKNVLIRSHQLNVSQVIYDRRCLTLFTSAAYRSLISGRTIAIADLEKEIKTVDDLKIEMV